MATATAQIAIWRNAVETRAVKITRALELGRNAEATVGLEELCRYVRRELPECNAWTDFEAAEATYRNRLTPARLETDADELVHWAGEIVDELEDLGADELG
jgi:hypothetical protein